MSLGIRPRSTPLDTEPAHSAHALSHNPRDRGTVVSVYFWERTRMSPVDSFPWFALPYPPVTSILLLFYCCLITFGTLSLELTNSKRDSPLERPQRASTSTARIIPRSDTNIYCALAFIFQQRRLISWIHWFSPVNHCPTRSFDFHHSFNRECSSRFVPYGDIVRKSAGVAPGVVTLSVNQLNSPRTIAGAPASYSDRAGA